MERNEKINNLNQLKKKIYEKESIFINVQIELEKFINTLSPDAIWFCQSQKTAIDLQRDYEAGRYECPKEDMKERVDLLRRGYAYICSCCFKKICLYYGGEKGVQFMLDDYLRIRRKFDKLNKEIWDLESKINKLMLELGMPLSPDHLLRYQNLDRYMGSSDRKMLDYYRNNDFASFLKNYDLTKRYYNFCRILDNFYSIGVLLEDDEKEWCNLHFYIENFGGDGTWKEFLINAKTSVASKVMKELKKDKKRGIK